MLGSGLAALLLLVACDPVLHPEFVVREPPTSPVTFQLLSGDGRFSVVRSTGHSKTVPSAGLWRVDRRTGRSVRLPDGERATKISRNGRRVLIATGDPSTGGTTVLWSVGAVLSPPPGTRFSEDLTFGVFVDADGAVKTWETATQSSGLVEPGFPRPPGTVSATPTGISDDGRTIQYELQGSQSIERFVHLDTAQAVDRPKLDGTGGESGYVIDRFVLAASGNSFVHVHEAGHFDFEGCVCSIVDESWAELVALPAGTAGRRYTNTTGESIDRQVFIATDGNAAWIYQSLQRLCPNIPVPITTFCVVASTAVVVTQNGSRAFDTGPSALGAIDISSNGRMLLIDTGAPGLPLGGSLLLRGPVQVIDWVTGNVESLSRAATYEETRDFICRPIRQQTPCTLPARSSGAQVSDDLQVVGTTTSTGAGWYEYSVAPPTPNSSTSASPS
jgi:hypothetical protein